MKNYTVIDTEMVFDRYLDEAYRSIDKRCDRTRVGARRLTMVALLDIGIDDLGKITVGKLRSWTTEQQGEGAMLQAVFHDLRQCADNPLVSYGGQAMDMKVIELAAMSYDLSLPPQLVQSFGPRRAEQSHLDLGSVMKGYGKTWHHLSELLLRLGFPVALLRDKANPDLPFRTGNWQLGREHCELDTLLTAIAFVAWKKIQGSPCVHIPEATYALIEGYLRQRPDAIAAPILRREQEQLLAGITARLQQAA
ncbi:MAG: hypothetical protein WA908_07005 [Pontixanthobacter sp.]